MDQHIVVDDLQYDVGIDVIYDPTYDIRSSQRTQLYTVEHDGDIATISNDSLIHMLNQTDIGSIQDLFSTIDYLKKHHIQNMLDTYVPSLPECINVLIVGYI